MGSTAQQNISHYCHSSPFTGHRPTNTTNSWCWDGCHSLEERWASCKLASCIGSDSETHWGGETVMRDEQVRTNTRKVWDGILLTVLSLWHSQMWLSGFRERLIHRGMLGSSLDTNSSLMISVKVFWKPPGAFPQSNHSAARVRKSNCHFSDNPGALTEGQKFRHPYHGLGNQKSP